MSVLLSVSFWDTRKEAAIKSVCIYKLRGNGYVGFAHYYGLEEAKEAG